MIPNQGSNHRSETWISTEAERSMKSEKDIPNNPEIK